MKIYFSKNIEKFEFKEDGIVFHWSPCGFGYKRQKTDKTNILIGEYINPETFEKENNIKYYNRFFTSLRFSKLYPKGIYTKNIIKVKL